MKHFKIFFLCLWIICSYSNDLAYAACSKDNTVQIAVTADFSATFLNLSKQFTQQTAYCVKQSVASTGVLYTEITHGAPFDIFLAADAKRPELLVQQGLASSQYLQTYAIGHLVLLAPQQPLPLLVDKILANQKLRIAISNPALAPYGQATKETLTHLQLWPQLQNRLLMANDVNEALTYVLQGGAEIGFVSLAQIKQLQQKNTNPDINNFWLVPEKLHQPIIQQAVLLKPAEKNSAALAFFHYLQTAPAAKIIQAAGYTVS